MSFMLLIKQCNKHASPYIVSAITQYLYGYYYAIRRCYIILDINNMCACG